MAHLRGRAVSDESGVAELAIDAGDLDPPDDRFHAAERLLDVGVAQALAFLDLLQVIAHRQGVAALVEHHLHAIGAHDLDRVDAIKRDADQAPGQFVQGRGARVHRLTAGIGDAEFQRIGELDFVPLEVTRATAARRAGNAIALATGR